MKHLGPVVEGSVPPAGRMIQRQLLRLLAYSRGLSNHLSVLLLAFDSKVPESDR